MVLWREPEITDDNGSNAWPSVRAQLESSRNQLAQLQRILDEPKFRTEGRGKLGPGYLLPHLSTIKSYAQLLSWEASLALHDGRREDAWIALRSLSRLATRWEPEPFQISQSVRIAVVIVVQRGMWEALQDGAWSEDQLKELQAEWERLDLFSRFPDSAAIDRVANLLACEERRTGKAEGVVPPFREAMMNPGGPRVDALKGWFSLWNKERSYLRKGVFEDEIAIITYFTQREGELRKAAASPTFVAMKERVSTTNRAEFPSSSESLIGTLINLKQLQQGWFNSQHQGLLGHLATAESCRRMVVTALAVKRYAIRNGRLPDSLGQLVPGFMREVPADYMDGMTLRYRSRADGGFLLYSVGLDCKDDGGDQRSLKLGPWDPPGPSRDIGWPFPAGEEELRLSQEAKQAWEQMQEAADTSLLILERLQSWGLVPAEEPDDAESAGDPP